MNNIEHYTKPQREYEDRREMTASVVSRSKMKISRMTNDNREKFFVSLWLGVRKKNVGHHTGIKGYGIDTTLKIHHYPII